MHIRLLIQALMNALWVWREKKIQKQRTKTGLKCILTATPSLYHAFKCWPTSTCLTAMDIKPGPGMMLLSSSFVFCVSETSSEFCLLYVQNYLNPNSGLRFSFQVTQKSGARSFVCMRAILHTVSSYFQSVPFLLSFFPMLTIHFRLSVPMYYLQNISRPKLVLAVVLSF